MNDQTQIHQKTILAFESDWSTRTRRLWASGTTEYLSTQALLTSANHGPVGCDHGNDKQRAQKQKQKRAEYSHPIRTMSKLLRAAKARSWTLTNAARTCSPATFVEST